MCGVRITLRQRRKLVGRRARLDGVNVETRTRNGAVAERVIERVLVHDRAAAVLTKIAVGFIAAKVFASIRPLFVGKLVACNETKSRFREQAVERRIFDAELCLLRGGKPVAVE